MLLGLLLSLVLSVANKQVTKAQKAMLLFFWFFSFFPLVLIPTEVVLMVNDGGSANTSSRVQMNKMLQKIGVEGSGGMRVDRGSRIRGKGCISNFLGDYKLYICVKYIVCEVLGILCG